MYPPYVNVIALLLIEKLFFLLKRFCSPNPNRTPSAQSHPLTQFTRFTQSYTHALRKKEKTESGEKKFWNILKHEQNPNSARRISHAENLFSNHSLSSNESIASPLSLRFYIYRIFTQYSQIKLVFSTFQLSNISICELF